MNGAPPASARRGAAGRTLSPTGWLVMSCRAARRFPESCGGARRRVRASVVFESEKPPRPTDQSRAGALGRRRAPGRRGGASRGRSPHPLHGVRRALRPGAPGGGVRRGLLDAPAGCRSRAGRDSCPHGPPLRPPRRRRRCPRPVPRPPRPAWRQASRPRVLAGSGPPLGPGGRGRPGAGRGGGGARASLGLWRSPGAPPPPRTGASHGPGGAPAPPSGDEMAGEAVKPERCSQGRRPAGARRGGGRAGRGASPSRASFHCSR